MIRTFVAVEIPKKIREEIGKIISEYEGKIPCRWVATRNLHITLLFLGEISEKFLEDVKRALARVATGEKGFRIRLGSFGAFPSPKNPRVFWIGVSEGEKEITGLHEKITEELTKIGFKPEERRFHPHLTIGRAKGVCRDISILERDYESELIPIDSVVLFKSTLTPEGPVYEKIEEYPLKGLP